MPNHDKAYDKAYDKSLNRISRIVPDQVGCHVRTAKRSGWMIPDQLDGRRVHFAMPSSLGGWTRKSTPIKAAQAVAVSKKIRLSLVIETTSGGSLFAEALAPDVGSPSSKALASVVSDASD